MMSRWQPGEIALLIIGVLCALVYLVWVAVNVMVLAGMGG